MPIFRDSADSSNKSIIDSFHYGRDKMMEYLPKIQAEHPMIEEANIGLVRFSQLSFCDERNNEKCLIEIVFGNSVLISTSILRG